MVFNWGRLLALLANIRLCSKGLPETNLLEVESVSKRSPTQGLSLSVCLSASLPACLPDWLPDCLTVWHSVCLALCLSVCLALCLYVCLPACLCAYAPVCLSVYLSICLSIYLFISPFFFFLMAKSYHGLFFIFRRVSKTCYNCYPYVINRDI